MRLVLLGKALIKAHFPFYPKKDKPGASDTNGQAKDVQKTVALVLPQMAKGNAEEIFKHDGFV